jgi:hypothetical protein
VPKRRRERVRRDVIVTSVDDLARLDLTQHDRLELARAIEQLTRDEEPTTVTDRSKIH